MKNTWLLAIVLFCLGPVAAMAQVPQMRSVDPGKGKIGSVLRINGTFLDKAQVEEVYLTDHALDMKVKVLDQTANWIQFRIPPSVKPGRLQLLIKTAGRTPKLLEQPVYITVEEAETTEVAASSH
jgi:hypothetical protein